MNNFFRSRNFLRFVKNKKNSNLISNFKINAFKSRCLDKIEKRSYISLTSSPQTAVSLSLNLITSGELSNLITAKSSLDFAENDDLNFIINEDLILENWYINLKFSHNIGQTCITKRSGKTLKI